MASILHGSARTTPRARAELQAPKEKASVLARRYGLGRTPVNKWHSRSTTADARMGPHDPRSTVLTPVEEAMIVAFRQRTLLPLDDVMGCLRDQILKLTRSSLHQTQSRLATVAWSWNKPTVLFLRRKLNMGDKDTESGMAPRASTRRPTSRLPAKAAETEAKGVAAVERALSILLAFREHDKSLTLGELSRRTGLYKSTTLRLLASLEHHHFVFRLPDGQYSLGVMVFHLGSLYERSWDLRSLLQPVLDTLVVSTGESATFYVRERDQRLCLMRADSRHNVRDHLPIGALLPMDRGSGARILRCYASGPGPDRGENLLVTSRGERDKEVGGVGAPVFGQGNHLIGALCISGTVTRVWAPSRMKVIKTELLAQARHLTSMLGGNPSIFDS